MTRRWNWVALALISLDAVHAQQNPKAQLTVQVRDVSGANVPNALIEVSSSQNTQTQVSNADGHGKANFDLPFGNYEVLVKSQGFCPFRRFLEPLALPSQIINVKLRIDQCPGPCEIGCVTVESIPGVQAAQAPRGPLTIVIATDETGTAIQGAGVEVVSTLPGKFGWPWAVSSITNTLGEVSFGLPSGEYILSVTADGFKKWSEHIDGGTRVNQTIRAKLVVAPPLAAPPPRS